VYDFLSPSFIESTRISNVTKCKDKEKLEKHNQEWPAGKGIYERRNVLFGDRLILRLFLRGGGNWG